MNKLLRLTIVSVYCIGLGEPLLASQAMVRKDTEFDEIGDVSKKVCLSLGLSESELFKIEKPFTFEGNNNFESPTSSTDLLMSAVDSGLPGSVKALFARGKDHFVGTSTVLQDFYKAFACFKKVAAYHHAPAFCELGILYLNGQGVEKDVDKALEHFIAAVQLGDKQAYEQINNIGTYFATGRGVTQDYKKAVSCYEQAMRGKALLAYYNLGSLYFNGQGVDKNLDRARELFTQAAQLGDKQAYQGIFNIGNCFATGRGVTQDYKQAVSCFEQAAQGKIVEAYYNLGVLYLNGQGVDKNLDKARELFIQATQLGDKQAYQQINKIGSCFDTGTGVTQDYKKAVSCYEQAIQGKVPLAYYSLGVLYFNGQGVDKNLDKARELFTQAVELGYKLSYERFFDIGICFATGSGVTQDYKKAVSCYEQAIQGKVPLAYYNLGALYLNGQGVDKNLDKARELFTQAAQFDDKQAYQQINEIGICFATGTGVTQDYKKAVSCYEQAIRWKVPSAYYGLGVLYFNGQGVDGNLDKALELFTQAAELGFQDACVVVYHCFAKGIRVKKDEKRAAAYLKTVAENIGEQEAKKRVDEKVTLFLSDDPKINCVGEMSACPICMNKFDQGDAITILACGAQVLHIFCKGCLDIWRATCSEQRRSLSCPYCRSTTASVFQGHAF